MLRKDESPKFSYIYHFKTYIIHTVLNNYTTREWSVSWEIHENNDEYWIHIGNFIVPEYCLATPEVIGAMTRTCLMKFVSILAADFYHMHQQENANG